MGMSARVGVAVLALAATVPAIYFATRDHDLDAKEIVATGLVATPDPIDFGDVPWTETARRTVLLRNASDHEMLLRDPKPDSTAFSVSKELSTNRLRPGQTAELEIMLSPGKSMPGPFRRTLTIESGDPSVHRLEVPMVGTIKDFRRVTGAPK